MKDYVHGHQVKVIYCTKDITIEHAIKLHEAGYAVTKWYSDGDSLWQEVDNEVSINE